MKYAVTSMPLLSDRRRGRGPGRGRVAATLGEHDTTDDHRDGGRGGEHDEGPPGPAAGLADVGEPVLGVDVRDRVVQRLAGELFVVHA